MVQPLHLHLWDESSGRLDQIRDFPRVHDESEEDQESQMADPDSPSALKLPKRLLTGDIEGPWVLPKTWDGPHSCANNQHMHTSALPVLRPVHIPKAYKILLEKSEESADYHGWSDNLGRINSCQRDACCNCARSRYTWETIGPMVHHYGWLLVQNLPTQYDARWSHCSFDYHS